MFTEFLCNQMKAQKQIHKTLGRLLKCTIYAKLSQKIHLFVKVFKIDSGIFFFRFFIKMTTFCMFSFIYIYIYIKRQESTAVLYPKWILSVRNLSQLLVHSFLIKLYFSVKCTFYYFYFTVSIFSSCNYKVYKQVYRNVLCKRDEKAKVSSILIIWTELDTLTLEDREIHSVNGQQRDNSQKTKCYVIILQVMNLFY